MRTKMALAVLAASTLAAGNMSAFGGVLKSESTPATSEAQTEEASGAEYEAQTVSIETSEYYFGKINVPYADFYYGEINHVQPEALEDAAAGQYDAEDKVTAAGLREEGIYDSVTSATSQKSQRFEKSYFEQNGDGTDILGPSSVNVAIPKTLYDDVKAAIEAGTECSNPLVEFVSSLEEVSEEVPAEYKVINSDGTLSQTIGTTNEAENVTVSFATVSTWGNYQIDFDGLEIESADIQGKTITKVTYMLADQDDISIETDLYCKELLGEEYSITIDESVTYQKDGTAINITYTTPDDSDYSVEAVAAGRTAVEDGLYSVDDNVITLSGDLKPGSYTVTFSDDKYASKKSSTLVESGLEEGSVSIENNAVVISDNEQGLTGADYAAQVTSVVVNGEPVNAKGIAGILFNEDGSINMDAEIEGQDGNVKVFDGSDSYEIELEATGYPSVKGTVTAQ